MSSVSWREMTAARYTAYQPRQKDQRNEAFFGNPSGQVLRYASLVSLHRCRCSSLLAFSVRGQSPLLHPCHDTGRYDGIREGCEMWTSNGVGIARAKGSRESEKNEGPNPFSARSCRKPPSVSYLFCILRIPLTLMERFVQLIGGRKKSKIDLHTSHIAFGYE